LPEPVVEQEPDEDVTLPLLLALERLSPLERAAFLLHDVFGLGFEEVAATVERDEAACRQLASRARVHVRESRPRYQLEKARGLELAEAFYSASRSGDMTALGAMLASDVSVYSDGGGKRPAALRPLHGLEDVMKLHGGLARVYAKHASALVHTGFINGLPGFVTREGDGELQTTALQIEDDRIVAVYIVRNPDKLRHLH
jgi:RNA polymerase sigma-70 factor (ECF subfamily)